MMPPVLPGLLSEFWAWAYKKALVMLTQPAGGIGIVETLGSGYSVEEDRMEKAAKLATLCADAVSNPEWIAHDITGDGIAETFCNRAAASIAEGMGCLDLRPDQTANQMILAMMALPGWRQEFDLARVAPLAQRGVLVMLAAVGPVHGHIVAAAPLPPEESGSWGGPVPMVAQVGTAAIGNGIKRLSQAFKAADRHELRIFILEATES
ncbi:MAG: hypothetical protein PHS14_02945 [Elusimicrobia bacterium]|nr:hypothetical protein [Elusimicrobiota bacterium]